MFLAAPDIFAHAFKQMIGLLRRKDKRNKITLGQRGDIFEGVALTYLPTHQKIKEAAQIRQYGVDRIGVFADIGP